jgi:hypothetical protein
VCQVNLLEKLLVPLLSKLGNLVVDGGIWLNTQRPEWNDANNALVGHGLSMVTLYYLRRYVCFLQGLLADMPNTVNLSEEVGLWLTETCDALKASWGRFDGTRLTGAERYQLLMALGQAADRYRSRVYEQEGLSAPVATDLQSITALLEASLAAFDHSIRTNRRQDALYEAYNLLDLGPETVEIDTLYPMLEGQVAALSSGAIPPTEAAALVERLFDSPLFRADQNTFLLYPDRDLPRFLEKNRVPEELIDIPLITQMLERGDTRLIERDAAGTCRFSADFRNVGDLDARLELLAAEYEEAVKEGRDALRAVYEKVFNHKAFTGRSGGMFGFEGLGSIYWHMVAKLLLAVQENFFAARARGADADTCQRLGHLYYRVREGIGFNKTPAEYGAFPMDPYSHTPGHIGAQQPGMTGQVKEELVARFGELGIRVSGGAVRFDPALLRPQEFADTAQSFRYLDVAGNWTETDLPGSGLAFTWCQVPLIYQLDGDAGPAVSVLWASGEEQLLSEPALPAEIAAELFQRSGKIRQLSLRFAVETLFVDSADH